MSKITVVEQGVDPPNPPAGQQTLFATSTGFRERGSTGASTPLGADVASQGEVDAGTDDAKIVTPLKLATTPRLPTQGENDALVGTNGTPGTGNKYVTDSDSRNSDARTPATHATYHKHGGSDEIAAAVAAANVIPKATAAGKLADGFIAESSITQHEQAIDHDMLVSYALAQHRVINDAGTSATELWSASKISADIAAVSSGTILKPGIATSSFGHGNLTLSGEQTLNSLLTSASRILVCEQTASEDNGIYDTAAGAWARSADSDTDAETNNGDTVHVMDSGSDEFGHHYTLVTVDPITVGTTGQIWDRFTHTDASETVAGVIEIATQVETDAGTDDARAITPLKLATYCPLPLCDEAVASSVITRSSNTMALMAGMTKTPPAGNYAVFVNLSLRSEDTGAPTEFQIFAGGAAAVDSFRRFIVASSDGRDELAPYTTQAKVVVNGSQAIEVRWASEDAETVQTAEERSMLIIKVAA